MTTQRHRVNFSIASPAEIERTAQQLAVVREDFLSADGSLARWTPRLLIFNSWQRCRTLHVNPSRRYAPLAVTRETQLYGLRDENALLIQAARIVMNHLVDVFADSGYVIVLSDTQGRLLEVMGDAAIRSRLARIDFVAGGDWSEAAAGTNAIGTALADGHVVQLLGAEHYCDGWQDLTCTAAPIHHPYTHEIIGILDLTGNYRLIRPFLTSFLATAALEIEQQLHMLLPSYNYSEQRQNCTEYLIGLPHRSQASERNMSNMHPHQQWSNVTLNTPFADNTLLNSSIQEQRVHEAERLTTACSVVSASLDLQLTLEKVVTQTAYLLKIERVGVHIFNERDEIISVHFLSAQPSLKEEVPDILAAHLDAHTGVVALIRERGEPVLINDVLTSKLLPASFAEQTGIRAMALLPLVTPRGVNGFISLSKPMAHNWFVEDIRLGLAFATQSATAIENARLFEVLQQQNRHMAVLNAIAHSINTLPDPSQHFDQALQRIADIMYLGGGLILLLDPSENRLMLASQYGTSEKLHYAPDIVPWNTLHTLACQVVDTQEPLLIAGNKDECRGAIHQTPDMSPRPNCFYNLLAVPLVASSVILGVLLVGHYANQNFGEADMKLFITIGQQLGLAIKNAQLLRAANEIEVLRAADRLKSGFLAAVSHDLRSPLTAIHASIESLLDDDGIQSATGKQRLLQNVAGQTHRLGQLVDQLLDLSRIEAGVLSLDRDWTDISVLIYDATKEFERLHYGCHIQLSFDTQLPLYYIDPDRIVQVLWNLLENAFKYASHHPPIQVKTRMLENEILISVIDRGPGIPKEEHEKIFQRFYRLDRDQRAHTQGSGLGLAICRGTVEAHGGRIWVENNTEGGCIFSIALPLPIADPIEYDPSTAQEIQACIERHPA
ncbi:MAG: ATP-binding protein [Ktedonobacteraceae bacterium]